MLSTSSEVKYNVLKENSSSAYDRSDSATLADETHTKPTHLAYQFNQNHNPRLNSSSTASNVFLSDLDTINMTDLEADNSSPKSLKSNESHDQLEMSNFKHNQLKYQSNQQRVEISIENNLSKKHLNSGEDIECRQSYISNIPSLAFSTPSSNKIFKRNSSKKCIKTLFFVIFLLAIVIFALLVSTYKQITKQHSSSSVCDSPKCILLAASIYNSLNTKMDPCDDFYEYSCGGWIRNNLIPGGFPRWGTLSLITYRNQLLIKEELESNQTDSQLTEAELKTKAFYRSCIDQKETIEKLGPTPLINILNKFMYKDSSNRLFINDSFSNLLSLIQINYGLNTLFEVNVLDDDKNSSFSNIEIIQGSLGLDRSFYIKNSSDKNSKVLETYKNVIMNVMQMLFGKVQNISEETDGIIELETKLAEIMLPTEKLVNIENLYNKVKLADMNKSHLKFFDWTRFFNQLLKTYDSSETLNENDEIIVMGLQYFTKLNELLDEYLTNSTKEKTLKLTMVFHLVKLTLPLLSKEYRAQSSVIGEAITGSNAFERWQTCIERADNIFGLGYAISKMFIRRSPINAKTIAQNMIKSIKESFVNKFKEITWMDEETRLLAKEKVNYVDELIGYPDFLDNDELIDLRYKELNIDENDYFGNEIRLIQYAMKSEIVTYRTRVNRYEWEMTSSAVNAYYSPTRNQIVFPSGILQDPFFHPDNPMSINYGSIGSVMGHELTHGFDNSGREYDKFGMMHQWWKNQTVDNFKNASKCMVEQYAKYKMGEENLNGIQTLGENIADNGGLRAAHEAYNDWVRKNGPEKQLPLLDLNHQQLFFISFAQTWCSKSTSDSIHLSLSVDQHSPPRYRVLGTLSNSEEFAKAFNCPKNSNMNPANKCRIW